VILLAATKAPALPATPEPLARFLLDRGVLLLVVLVALLVVQQLAFLLIRRISRFVAREAGADRPEVKKRADPGASLLKSVTNVILILFGVVFVLEILGVDVRPFLAGAGILGVALGFGAQSLVKDCLTGVFILAEHQIAVGDSVAIAGVTGTVDRVTVRSVTLRDAEGRVHYVPNGEIRVVTNLSQGVARFLVDVPIPAQADAALALATLLEVARAFAADPARRGRLLETPEVLGFERLGAGQNTIRMAVRALRQDQALARDLRYAALRALAAHGIVAGSTAAETAEPIPPEPTGDSVS
jgi:small conductance mechanosensitive channel